MNYPSIDRLACGINKTNNNKEAILFCVETNKKIKEKIKRMEQKAKEANKKIGLEYFSFNKNEIERIVINKKDKDER